MNILPIGTTNTNSVAEPKKVEQAAREFESLLISEMLRSSRESASSGLGDQESDSEESTMQDMADQQFSQLLAQNGGIGVAHLVVNGLNKNTGN